MSPMFYKLVILLMYFAVLWCSVQMATVPGENRTPGSVGMSLGDPNPPYEKAADVNNYSDLVQDSGGTEDGATAKNLKLNPSVSVSSSISADLFTTNSTTKDNPVTDSDTSLNSTNQDKEQTESVWYSTAGWLPIKGIKSDRNVNLTVLPMLAIIFFLFGICVKCYSWMRDQDRTKARGQLDFEDDEVNYSIITAGEQGYKEVDIRSETTSMYDTVNSFRAFRFPGNDYTVTSVKSLPEYNVHRTILMQKVDEGVYETVQSYKAFLERAMQTNDMDIEVELVSDYKPRKRSKSYEFAPCSDQEDPPRSRKRRMRRHSGGRSVEGNVRTQTERERRRRHSEKTPGNPGSLKNKTFHRRSSPAILEPLVPGQNLLPHLEEDGQGPTLLSRPHHIDRQASNSSSSSQSNSDSEKKKSTSQKLRRERLRRNRSSQDRLVERLVKGSSHSSGHCSDDSPQSSASSIGNSSNELESDSDVTDSGLVAEGEQSATHRCYKHPKPADLGGRGAHKDVIKKLQRFKVSFVDEASLSAGSDSRDGDTKKLNDPDQC